MTRIFAILILVLASATAIATSPVQIINGPPAQLEMRVYSKQHEIFITPPAASLNYTPGKIVAELYSNKPSFFQVELAPNVMQDGRIRLRVFIDPSLEPLYFIRIFDKGSEPWHELYSGSLQSIPRAEDGT